MLSRKAASEPQLISSQASEDDIPLSRYKEKYKKTRNNAQKHQIKHTSNLDGETVFQLSAKRRLTVRKWKSTVLVDVREFYDDNGEPKPGKKGISLSLDQWKKLMELSDAVTEAVALVEEDCIRVLIDLREFYDQDGVAKPGKKGISLSKDQWVALQEVAADVTDAAERL
ncbi:hypothetical protein BBI17_007650 [Phytophthora kernoviae]|uniref:Transcriptional coactivator p15 (PC4) C-terminal domain-containing protein n=1 Tax=Phytophthora kernoviae TaxID=325452 RepID=A0A421F207_9STRA|nr:hypothetical protein BBI17_007650 [Phytophthora kernoviae]